MILANYHPVFAQIWACYVKLDLACASSYQNGGHLVRNNWIYSSRNATQNNVVTKSLLILFIIG